MSEHSVPLAPAATRQRLHAGGRILVSRLRHLGDVILTLPLLRALRVAFPNVELHYLTEPLGLEALRAHPDVMRTWCARRGACNGAKLAYMLHRMRFDVAIDLFSNPRSALLVRATAAPVRIGEARRGRRHLYTHARHLLPGRSALGQHLAALEVLGVPLPRPSRPQLFLDPDERERGRKRWSSSVERRPSVLVHLGASHVAKEWPTAEVVDCVQQLRALGLGVVLSTAPARAEPSAAVARLLTRAGTAVGLLPALPLREFLATLAEADAVLSVDGGIVHASVALARPTVALFGPTDAPVWFPYAEFGAYEVLTAGSEWPRLDLEHCARALCMQRIRPRDAVDALQRVLRAPEPSAVPDPSPTRRHSGYA